MSESTVSQPMENETFDLKNSQDEKQLNLDTINGNGNHISATHELNGTDDYHPQDSNQSKTSNLNQEVISRRIPHQTLQSLAQKKVNGVESASLSSISQNGNGNGYNDTHAKTVNHGFKAPEDGRSFLTQSMPTIEIGQRGVLRSSPSSLNPLYSIPNNMELKPSMLRASSESTIPAPSGTSSLPFGPPSLRDTIPDPNPVVQTTVKMDTPISTPNMKYFYCKFHNDHHQYSTKQQTIVSTDDSLNFACQYICYCNTCNGFVYSTTCTHEGRIFGPNVEVGEVHDVPKVTPDMNFIYCRFCGTHHKFEIAGSDKYEKVRVACKHIFTCRNCSGWNSCPRQYNMKKAVVYEAVCPHAKKARAYQPNSFLRIREEPLSPLKRICSLAEIPNRPRITHSSSSLPTLTTSMSSPNSPTSPATTNPSLSLSHNVGPLSVTQDPILRSSMPPSSLRISTSVCGYPPQVTPPSHATLNALCMNCQNNKPIPRTIVPISTFESKLQELKENTEQMALERLKDLQKEIRREVVEALVTKGLINTDHQTLSDSNSDFKSRVDCILQFLDLPKFEEASVEQNSPTESMNMTDAEGEEEEDEEMSMQIDEDIKSADIVCNTQESSINSLHSSSSSSSSNLWHFSIHLPISKTEIDQPNATSTPAVGSETTLSESSDLSISESKTEPPRFAAGAVVSVLRSPNTTLNLGLELSALSPSTQPIFLHYSVCTETETPTVEKKDRSTSSISPSLDSSVPPKDPKPNGKISPSLSPSSHVNVNGGSSETTSSPSICSSSASIGVLGTVPVRVVISSDKQLEMDNAVLLLDEYLGLSACTIQRIDQLKPTDLSNIVALYQRKGERKFISEITPATKLSSRGTSITPLKLMMLEGFVVSPFPSLRANALQRVPLCLQDEYKRNISLLLRIPSLVQNRYKDRHPLSSQVPSTTDQYGNRYIFEVEYLINGRIGTLLVKAINLFQMRQFGVHLELSCNVTNTILVDAKSVVLHTLGNHLHPFRPLILMSSPTRLELHLRESLDYPFPAVRSLTMIELEVDIHERVNGIGRTLSFLHHQRERVVPSSHLIQQANILQMTSETIKDEIMTFSKSIEPLKRTAEEMEKMYNNLQSSNSSRLAGSKRKTSNEKESLEQSSDNERHGHNLRKKKHNLGFYSTMNSLYKERFDGVLTEEHEEKKRRKQEKKEEKRNKRKRRRKDQNQTASDRVPNGSLKKKVNSVSDLEANQNQNGRKKTYSGRTISSKHECGDGFTLDAIHALVSLDNI